VTIVVFGATSAIAEATLRRWAAQGARLGLVARNREKLDRVERDLRIRGASEVRSWVADLADWSGHASLIREIEASLGNIDTALVAYGNLPDQAKAQADFSVAEEAIRVNFTSVVSLGGLLADHFERNRHGTLAVLSSPAGDRGRQSNYIYGCAKGGLSIFLQGLRNRLTPAGVHVVTIIPGFVDTPMTRDLKKNALFSTPDRIARGIVAAVGRRRSVAYLPNYWWAIMAIIRAIPEFLFRRLSL
jgi:decaprenylphospho-beta-D-erythro-pentofuranosid-2-ulose 2-reductase